mgnify:CR=1 FL=1|jgi:hypothetical protein
MLFRAALSPVQVSSEMEDAIDESPELKDAVIVTPAAAVAGTLKVQYQLQRTTNTFTSVILECSDIYLMPC